MATNNEFAQSPQRAPDVLHYVPRYLNRSERFVWQQLRDWGEGTDLGTVRVATRRITDVASEFPHPNLIPLGADQRPLASLDHQASGLLRRFDGGARDELTLLEARRLANLVKKSDVVYCMFLWNAIELRHVLRNDQTPLVLHVAGSDIMTADSRGPEYLEAIDQIMERADLILCGSAFLQAEVVRRGVPASRCHVHYFGIDVPDATAVAGQPRPDIPLELLAVSRLHPVKGVEHTLSAFDEAFSDTTACLTIVGDGPERGALEAHARTLKSIDRITFTGELDHDAVNQHMRRADVFVQHNVTDPSGGQEGCGGTILEASAHGLPVVATRSGGVPEAVLDESSGLLVEPGDVTAMAAALRTVAAAPDLRRSLGKAGRAHVDAVHNARTQNQKLAEILRDLDSRGSQLRTPLAD